MNCQIFACVHLFELKMILSYCDITNRSELLVTHLAGCTNRHPSWWRMASLNDHMAGCTNRHPS